MSAAMLDAVAPRTSARASQAQVQLIYRFLARIATTPEAQLLRAVTLEDAQAFAAIAELAPVETQPAASLSKRVQYTEEKKRSIAVRNQLADANMRKRAFTRAQQRCDLLDASEVCDILGIKKQALSQRTQSGKLLVYSEGRRRYYPGFQFDGNRVKPIFERLIEEMRIDPADTSRMNLFIQFLLDRIDLAEPDTSADEKYRHELLDTAKRIDLFKRDFDNMGTMGH
ncbi:MerR family transcriptional regulator [Pseudomonas fulva]|nr:helix-turn-helix domain-containing protein [Pseudomonas fulva]MBF8780009.1 helix-turn-helix domain-containing protein [Pseudomonas fulva]